MCLFSCVLFTVVRIQRNTLFQATVKYSGVMSGFRMRVYQHFMRRFADILVCNKFVMCLRARARACVRAMLTDLTTDRSQVAGISVQMRIRSDCQSMQPIHLQAIHGFALDAAGPHLAAATVLLLLLPQRCCMLTESDAINRRHGDGRNGGNNFRPTPEFHHRLFKY